MKTLSLLIKPASGSCQLRCRYCFYKDITESRQVGNYGLMKPGTLDCLVSRAIKETEETCSFSFQGGEPTLVGLAFYQQLLELQNHYKKKYNKNRLRINNAVQTNGMLLDADWCRFFAQNKFLVGLSLDGDKTIHDLNRIDQAGKGTYNRVMHAARLMNEYGVEYNILCVVTRELARRAKRIYRSLVKNGFGYLQFIPCIDDFDANPGASPYSLTAERFGEFLINLFEEWYQDFRQGNYISIRHFDNWIHMLNGRPPETCSMSGRCTCYGVIEADGSVYPCDFYVLDAWRLGNLHESSLSEMLTSQRGRQFVTDSLPVADECRSCPYYEICRGGCRRDREPLDTENGTLNRYCQGYKAFFEHALPRLQQIARSVRY